MLLHETHVNFATFFASFVYLLVKQIFLIVYVKKMKGMEGEEIFFLKLFRLLPHQK